MTVPHPLADAEALVVVAHVGHRLAGGVRPSSLGQPRRPARTTVVMADEGRVPQLAPACTVTVATPSGPAAATPSTAATRARVPAPTTLPCRLSSASESVDEHVGGLVADGADELGEQPVEERLLEDHEEQRIPTAPVSSPNRAFARRISRMASSTEPMEATVGGRGPDQ